jgi:hypothetical protein
VEWSELEEEEPTGDGGAHVEEAEEEAGRAHGRLAPAGAGRCLRASLSLSRSRRFSLGFAITTRFLLEQSGEAKIEK